MKVLNKISVLFVLMLMGLVNPAYAKSRILVISNVDDTLKLSYTRSEWDRDVNAFYDYRAFPGMAELYQTLVSNKDTTFYYVSNAPTYLMQRRHTEFLQEFNFPFSKNLKTRPDVNNEYFKTQSILDLVKQEEPEILILIGHNGEHDVSSFHEVRHFLENQNILIIDLVHIVYSKVEYGDAALEPLNSDDKPYVTPVEIALYLGQMGILGPQDVKSYSDLIIPRIMTDIQNSYRSRAFPEWKDCSSYQWWIPLTGEESNYLPRLMDYIHTRCVSR